MTLPINVSQIWVQTSFLNCNVVFGLDAFWKHSILPNTFKILKTNYLSLVRMFICPFHQKCCNKSIWNKAKCFRKCRNYCKYNYFSL